MYDALLTKFTTHSHLKWMLILTGTRKIFEHTEKDSYWGDGLDGSGKNRSGFLIEKVRTKIRADLKK